MFSIHRDHFCVWPANEWRRYNATSSLIGCADAQNDLLIPTDYIMVIANGEACRCKRVDEYNILHHENWKV